MKKVELQVGEKKIKGHCEKVGSDYWISINGKTLKVQDSSSKATREKSKLVSNPNEVLAPMPGKITSLKMKIADVVKSGDTVVIMEAMKMEYSLKSQKNGKIKSIKVKSGDQVSLGQLLVEIE